jgi:hypothetical protein
MKILKEGQINVVDCNKCKSRIEFDEEDVLYHQDSFPESVPEHNYFYIDCPMCGQELSTAGFMSKELLEKSRKNKKFSV